MNLAARERLLQYGRRLGRERAEDEAARVAVEAVDEPDSAELAVPAFQAIALALEVVLAFQERGWWRSSRAGSDARARPAGLSSTQRSSSRWTSRTPRPRKERRVVVGASFVSSPATCLEPGAAVCPRKAARCLAAGSRADWAPRVRHRVPANDHGRHGPKRPRWRGP